MRKIYPCDKIRINCAVSLFPTAFNCCACELGVCIMFRSWYVTNRNFVFRKNLADVEKHYIRRPADTEARRRLRSVSSTSLDVRRTRLSTVGDRAIPVAAAHLWNSLPSHVTAAPSLSIFCCRLKSHPFSLSYPAFRLYSHLYSDRAVTRHLGYYNDY